MNEYLIVGLIHAANICNDLPNDSIAFDKSSFTNFTRRSAEIYFLLTQKTVRRHKHPLTRTLIALIELNSEEKVLIDAENNEDNAKCCH